MSNNDINKLHLDTRRICLKKSMNSEKKLLQSNETFHLHVEKQTLLDQISILKLQCKTYEEETKRAIDKLTCLKLLVKRYNR